MKKNTCKACINILNGVKTKRSILHTCSKTNREILEFTKKANAGLQEFYDNLTYKGD